MSVRAGFLVVLGVMGAVFLGGVAFAPAAFAAAPEAPLEQVTGRSASTVSLVGVLYPGAPGEPGSYEFLYNQSATECAGGGKSAPVAASGNQFEEVFETLTGLVPGVQYAICLAVTSPGGTTLSEPVTVTTAIPPEAPGGLRVEDVTATGATLEGTLNPGSERAAEPGSYEFLYRRSVSECEGESATASMQAFGARAETVAASVTELLPHTQYAFCLRAANEVGEVATSAASTFMTPAAPPAIEETFLTEVADTSATLQARIDPGGARTSYRFEVAPAGGPFALVGEAEGGAGTLPEGTTGVLVQAHVQHGLASSSEYRVRVVAENEKTRQAGKPLIGEPVPFTTQPASPSFSLLDGRAWEMVTPLDKHGAGLVGDSREGAINEAAVAGDAISYVASSSTEASAPGEPAPEFVQILSRHGSGGWGSRDIASPHEQQWEPEPGRQTEFLAFASDLTASVVEPKGQTLLGGASERTPYLRRQALCEASPPAAECYLPLVTSENVSSGEKWGGSVKHATGEVRVVGATPALTHVVLSSGVPLTPQAKGSAGSLYEWAAGKLELVSVLPGASGAPAEVDVHAQAVSADGDRIIWEGLPTSFEANHLYMHEAAAHSTVQLDVPQPGATGNERNKLEYMDASAESSLVFFSDTQQLTVGSHANTAAPDLYVYEARPDGDPEAGSLRDLTAPVREGEAGQLFGVAGVSADGSVVYVIASGVLSESANARGAVAQAGRPNLYRIQRGEAAGKVTWTASFIATLSEGDGGGDWARRANQTTSVSPSGRWLEFMSEAQLTGYDNRDAVSGERDEEVFLYDAASQRLECASCDPTGARPHGSVGGGEFSLTDPHLTWHGRWVAGLVPDWESSSKGEGVYQPRYLSDSGRLFFDAVDALVPQDVNGMWDVYEFEPAGVGSCSASSPAYHAGEGGCVDLVSSGISGEESAFLDASENGNDAFFLTAGKLVAGDTDSAFDVYDAHVCGSGWECPAPEAVKPPCTNTASCRQAAEPQPSVFGAPPSATFFGAGDRASVVRHKRMARCGKGRRSRVRRHGRCVRRRSGRRHGRRSGRGR